MNINNSIDTFLDFMKLPNGTPLVSVDFIDWLITNGFFTKPAAIAHHGNHTGGLFEHSLAVAQTLVEITDRLNIRWRDERSPYIVGMFHDICKVDDYVIDVAEGTATPDENTKWTRNKEKILNGHGDKSVMMLSQSINLTEEELLCIRFHMGAYETDNWNEYDRAIRKYDTVLWTHTADMFAAKVLDKQKEA